MFLETSQDCSEFSYKIKRVNKQQKDCHPSSLRKSLVLLANATSYQIRKKIVQGISHESKRDNDFHDLNCRLSLLFQL
jgi:hypothetical protein